MDIRHTLSLREKTHGNYSDHARITQNLKAMMHDSPNWNRLSADQIETLDMIAHKIGRILAGEPNFADHWQDIAGYATLSADRVAHHADTQDTPSQMSLPLTRNTLDKFVRGDADFNTVLAQIEAEARGDSQ